MVTIAYRASAAVPVGVVAGGEVGPAGCGVAGSGRTGSPVSLTWASAKLQMPPERCQTILFPPAKNFGIVPGAPGRVQRTIRRGGRFSRDGAPPARHPPSTPA